MNKEDKKLQKYLVDEMMKVSKTNPDVMIYMQALMESYEKLEQEIDRLNNIINELEKDIKNLYTYGIKNNAEQRDYLLNRLEGLKELKENNKDDN